MSNGTDTVPHSVRDRHAVASTVGDHLTHCIRFTVADTVSDDFLFDLGFRTCHCAFGPGPVHWHHDGNRSDDRPSGRDPHGTDAEAVK